jgi:hypothetical protein
MSVKYLAEALLAPYYQSCHRSQQRQFFPTIALLRNKHHTPVLTYARRVANSTSGMLETAMTGMARRRMQGVIFSKPSSEGLRP